MFESVYAYLILCGIYFLVWCGFFVFRKDLRKELLVITLFTAPLGLTEYLYWDYFRPEFLFPLLPRIGGEDFLWAGIVSGIGAVCYEVIAQRRSYHVRKLEPGWLGEIWLSITVLTGLALLYVTTTMLFINSAHVSIAGFLFIGLMIVLWRRDLTINALLSGLLLACITYLVYTIWLLFYPTAFSEFWMLENTYGIFVGDIPLEELLYSFSWGFVVGPMYELMAGFRLRRMSRA